MGRNHTHTHVYKGYKHSTHCAMIHAQYYEYKYGKDRYIPWAGHARISLNTVLEAQAQYTLCNGTTAVRVKTRANRYTARAGHELDVQHEWEEITVQARYTPCNGTTTARVRTRPISTRPVLVLRKNTRTARVQKNKKTGKIYQVHYLPTVQWYSHSTARVQNG